MGEEGNEEKIEMSAKEVDSLQPSSPTPPVYTEGKKANLRQHLTAIIAHFGAVLMAEVWSYSATALPSMRNSLELSQTDEAWMASITFLGGTVGSIISGFIAQKFGVRMSLIIVTIPILIGWVLITVGLNFPMILIGRFITGAFVAAIGVSSTLIAEISKPERRGRLNFLFDMMFCIGVLLIYLCGSFFNWRVQAGICTAQCILYLLLLAFIYESPRFLLEKGNRSKAEKALKYIRDEDDVTAVISSITSEIETDRKKDMNRNADGDTHWYSLFTQRSVLKGIYIALAMQVFLQLCGVVPIVCYAVDVFKEAGSTHENLSTCIFGLVNLVATCVAYFCIDKLGRKALMMISEGILVLTLFSLGLFLYLKDEVKLESIQVEISSWVPLVLLVIYIIGYSFGVGPIPWVVMGEVVSPKAKGASTGIVIFVGRICGFLAMFYFNSLMGAIGQSGVYWVFAGICFLGFFFSWFFLPETSGKDLETVNKDIKHKWIHPL